jgi:Asp-tRNA(Asn)/Glu-tRNA(Gln) amidotransferase A subunit family amidase
MAADLELCFAPATRLARLLAVGEISSEQLVRNALDRIDETHAALNAFSHIDADGATRSARERDRERATWRSHQSPLGPLHGLPISVKELIEVQGLPCRYGSLTMADHVPRADAPSVARVRRSGAVILGMTNTSEFGFRGYTDNRVSGLTRNPWDTSRTPGGSSGGAASSVAAGATPFALGTDGGGSIRNPSSFTGLVGIKPQFGRVPVYPASATPTLAHVGPMARTVADARLLLEVMAGPDQGDWTSMLPAITSATPKPGSSGPRVAFASTLGYGSVDPEVERIVRSAVASLSGVCSVNEIEEPVCDEEAELFLAEFIGGVHARLGGALDEVAGVLDPALLNLLRQFETLPAARYTLLLRRRLLHRERMRQFFDRWDVLLTPMTPCAAWPIGVRAPSGLEQHRLWTFFGYPFNLTGQPAANLPCGFTASGLPVGMQVVVGPCQEGLLLALLEQFEQAIDLPARRPACAPLS